MANKLIVDVIISHSFGQNAYIAHLDGVSECVVVDPGFDGEAIQEQLTESRLTPKAFLNTHGHIDHIAGNQWMKRCWPDCPLVIGKEDAEKLVDPNANLSGQYGSGLTSPPADCVVTQGDRVEKAGLVLEVVEIPGHTKGHVVYVWKGESPWIVFGGDILFKRSIGRSDFPDGDPQLLLTSIQSKLLTMPDDTIVMPGHGESTTIGEEKRLNPFVGENA